MKKVMIQWGWREENMKLLILSDIHGSAYYMGRMQQIEMQEKPDKIILLGDLYYHGPRNPISLKYAPLEVAYMLNAYAEKMIAVKGNCDAEVDEKISNFPLQSYVEMEVDGLHIYCTHGHKYHKGKLPKKEFDVMLYGHLHTGFIEEENGKVFANPGSISLPRKEAKHSYLLYEDRTFTLQEINGEVLAQYTIKK